MTRVISPTSLGFVEIRPRVWARQHDPEHTFLLWFRAMKGGAVQVAWGTSVTYVPVKLVPKLTWARTLKQSQAALWQSSAEVEPAGPAWPIDGEVGTFNGPDCVGDNVRAIWDVVNVLAVRFWESTCSPDGLLAVAATMRPSWDRPDPNFVAAFALGPDRSLRHRS